MSDDDSLDSNGIKAVNITLKNKRKTRLSPLLNRRKSNYQDNATEGNENDAFDNRPLPSSRLSPSLGRRSPRPSPLTTCECMSENRGLTERNIPKCPECGRNRGVGNSAINAAWNDPLLGQNNVCKLYTGDQLKQRVRKERKGFDDLQVLDVEDQPSPVEYITIESKARLPKIVVTDTSKRSSRNVSSGAELATPIKLPPISQSSTPRSSSSFKFSELQNIQEHDLGNEEIPE